MSRTAEVDELDELLMEAVRAGRRSMALRQATVAELLERGKALVRADGKLYRIECREIKGEASDETI
jgi:hypothetical protein